MDEKALAVCRRAFAARMLAKASIQNDGALLRAFSTVQRECFLGPPPWKMADWDGYRDVPATDPGVVYQDALFALQPERQINNGSPSLHARGLHRLALRQGDTVCHIGAGSGYYTAMMSLLVGAGGRVVAVEFDRHLAERALRNLKKYPNVDVVHGNGLEWPEQPTDAIYVNFAVHRPADRWIERLKPGGRLIFPLGVPDADVGGRSTGFTAYAGFFLFSRNDEGYQAAFLGPVAFVWGEAAFGAVARYRRLETAFRKGGMCDVCSLRWKTKQLAEEWYSESDWGLVTARNA
ncbi:rRNA adenine N-6-methyltransferase family protein [Rhizobium sp. Root1220]|uniref:protein-L-isoaspartate O-methyltransferase family protein n=1 Tax=Rhizobium sp. Root1220 TaxID=1736432 RepID=UPI0006F2F3D5|nr:rRNA adenine N-6-methyltransferase family protein [Rhizobium sp. Root1220]KQV63922.1 protein-L-isoaspartate carboxylmethyltransferase [Rhizobium sp. Root1220]